MNSRTIKRTYRHVAPRLGWYVLAAAGVSGVVSVLALRHNYQTMSVLRDKVYEADKNNGDVEAALRNLRTYVYAHMNTDLSSGTNSIYPPIQLKYRYERLVAERATAAGSANSELYSQAQAYCEQQNTTDFSGRNRISCIEQYVTSRGGDTSIVVPDSLYKYDFVSPRWSPDLAGWSLVVTIVLACSGAALLILRAWRKKRS